MNLLERAITVVQNEGGAPMNALVFANLFLRGGKASNDEITEDSILWMKEHGQPTYPALLQWAAGLDIESALVTPLVKRTALEGSGMGKHKPSGLIDVLVILIVSSIAATIVTIATILWTGK